MQWHLIYRAWIPKLKSDDLLKFFVIYQIKDKTKATYFMFFHHHLCKSKLSNKFDVTITF